MASILTFGEKGAPLRSAFLTRDSRSRPAGTPVIPRPLTHPINYTPLLLRPPWICLILSCGRYELFCRKRLGFADSVLLGGMGSSAIRSGR